MTQSPRQEIREDSNTIKNTDTSVTNGFQKNPRESRIREIETVKPCRNCRALAKFDDSVRGKNGSRIPLDLDGGPHQCNVDIEDEEILVIMAIEYVATLNNRLQSSQLRVLREEKVRIDGND